MWYIILKRKLKGDFIHNNCITYINHCITYDFKKRRFLLKSFYEFVSIVSLNLNPADFYLWGYLKTVVYNPLPKTLEDLIANIKREINKIPESELKIFFENFEKKVSFSSYCWRRHFE